METIKCSVIGDERTGKSCMLISYTTNSMPELYIPTVYDIYSSVVEIEVNQIKLHLIDSAGQNYFDRLRYLSLPHTDVLLICFSVMNLESFRNVELKWILEARKYCPLAKVLLIGTQIDMRNDNEAVEKLKINEETPVEYAEGIQMAKKIGALKYMECSALTKVGLEEVFKTAAKSVLMPLDEKEDLNSQGQISCESKPGEIVSSSKFYEPTIQKSEDNQS